MRERSGGVRRDFKESKDRTAVDVDGRRGQATVTAGCEGSTVP